MAGELADDIRASMQELEGGDTQTVDEPQGHEEQQPDEFAEQPEPRRGGDRQRDASGKFAPKVPAKGEEEQQPEEQPQPPQDKQQPPQDKQLPQDKQEQQPAPTSRPPASWKPEARELWGKLEPTLQAEVMRREREITETLRTTAQARHFTQQFEQVIQPYMTFIQQENATPLQAVQSLMNTAARLRTETPQNKAAMVADLIMQYNVPIEDLDSVLSQRQHGGRGATAVDSQLVNLLDQRLKPVTEFMSTIQQRQQQVAQQTEQELETELTTFMEDPKNEFAWDVKEDMADILDLASRRGQKITLQDAYNRAILLNTSVSEVIQRRKAAGAAAETTAAARRAKDAAASLPSGGAPGRVDEEGGEGDDVRSDILSSVRALNRRA